MDSKANSLLLRLIRRLSVGSTARYHGRLSIACLAVLVVGGCHSRVKHFRRADRQAHQLIQEKACGKPWAVPDGYSLIPRPESRLAVQDCIVSPRLPDATESLYTYNLPVLRSELLSDADETSTNIAVGNERRARPIPPDAWAAIPQQCLQRMLDFDSIRAEVDSTKAEYSDFDLQLNDSEGVPKLTLEDVVDLALLNSRDYQTQKENLYLVSLQLSQERFAYQSKFSNGATGTALGFDHNRNAGTTVNNLAIPTGISRDRLLVTGGDLLASFANNILLTFNGPSGFAADVSSSMLLSYAQPIIQRDIRFESLTQAERNLVYAARDFARFRKQFFVDFAGSYYSLIVNFRRIEIESQNYFSLVRAFNQAKAEYETSFLPGFQVDQVEQQLLGGRGALIQRCNSVEQALDSLKLSIGIPTETQINVNLKELNELTRLDQLSVSADLSSRVLIRLRAMLDTGERNQLVSTAVLLLERLVDAKKLDDRTENEQEFSQLLRKKARFAIDEARLAAEQEEKKKALASQQPEEAQLQAVVEFRRTLAFCLKLLELNEKQIEYGTFGTTEESIPESTLESYSTKQKAFLERVVALDGELKKIFNPQEDQLQADDQSQLEVPQATRVSIADKVQSLLQRSLTLEGEIVGLVQAADQYLQIDVIEDPLLDRQRIVAQVEELIEQVSGALDDPDFGLKPIDIDIDDAMITALVLRFDLMNQRETVFDDWRQIKLAADELKSVFNIRASQRISTKSGANQPFNFTFDDSATALGFNFDAPLNRFAERNAFRGTLISYQRALRNLSQLEDNVKFSIRNDLRNLALDREQYLIDVASAALAYDRVITTSLQLTLGASGVTARDFLEAQTAYTSALTSVASQHIEYILDRTQLFLDLELLTVDENGFWGDLKNEEVQPEPAYSIPPWAQPVYGTLPRVKYSKEMRRLMCLPSKAATTEQTIAPPVDPGTTQGQLVPADSRLETIPTPSQVEELSPPPGEDLPYPALDLQGAPVDGAMNSGGVIKGPVRGFNPAMSGLSPTGEQAMRAGVQGNSQLELIGSQGVSASDGTVRQAAAPRW